MYKYDHRACKLNIHLITLHSNGEAIIFFKWFYSEKSDICFKVSDIFFIINCSIITSTDLHYHWSQMCLIVTVVSGAATDDYLQSKHFQAFQAHYCCGILHIYIQYTLYIQYNIPLLCHIKSDVNVKIMFCYSMLQKGDKWKENVKKVSCCKMCHLYVSRLTVDIFCERQN